MPDCFIISPIGESGSETRNNADDLRDLIIKPVMESFGFNVIRGDHDIKAKAGQIDLDVIRAVQESDLCVVDLSIPNPNVYYEFGRRDETGKPLILLKAKGSPDLPVDIATRRYIEYDLDSRSGLKEAIEQLKNAVEPLVQKGFESGGTGASLSELAELMRRIERKIDRIDKKTVSGGGRAVAADAGNIKGDPRDVFSLALEQNNIPMAEQAVKALRYTTDSYRWLSYYVEALAGRGSVYAGDTMIENAFEFIDSNGAFRDKIEYFTYIINNLEYTERSFKLVETAEKIFRTLEAVSQNETPENRASVCNQVNRLYFNVWYETRDTSWLDKSINILMKAIDIDDSLSYLYGNLAACLRNRNAPGDAETALGHALKSVELDGDEPSVGHIETVCSLMHDLEDERLIDYIEKLEEVNEARANLLRSRWNI